MISMRLPGITSWAIVRLRKREMQLFTTTRSSTQSVMPAEILVRVNKERAKRRESVVEPPAPFDPNTEQAKCREWSAIRNHQIGLGATSEAAAAYAMSVVSGHPSSRQAPEVER